jgi:putative hemolysin
MGPVIEMGRSFVRPEYQRSYSSLLLLWRGIGRFISLHPRYRRVIGPVSVSQGYQLISRQFIVAYLRQNRQMHPWSCFVHPRKPFRAARRGLAPHMARSAMKDVDDLSSLISQIEADEKGVPVLLRNYLKLGAAIMGFNVDPDFSNVLDVLVMIDLAHTEPKILERQILGPGTEEFLAYHRGEKLEAVEPVGV